MRILRVLVVAAIVFWFYSKDFDLLGEEPDLKSTLIYDAHGIRFEYPGNWEINMELHQGEGHNLMLDAGLKGTLTLTITPGPADYSLDRWSEPFLEKDETEGTIDTVSWGERRGPSKQMGRYEWLAIDVYGEAGPLDWVNYTQFYKLTGVDQLCIWNVQCDEEELDTMQPAFDLVLDSFTWNPNASLEGEISR